MFEYFVRFSLGFLLVFMALFLIALVLIQRGRGGGLAGAFGGAGGQSAFGTKAGDVFTRITVLVASCWILLCILASNVLSTASSRIAPTLGGSAGHRVTSEVESPPETETPPAEAGSESKDDDAAASESKPVAGVTETEPASRGVEAKGDAEEPKTDASEPSVPSPPTEPVSESSSPEPSSPAAE